MKIIFLEKQLVNKIWGYSLFQINLNNSIRFGEIFLISGIEQKASNIKGLNCNLNYFFKQNRKFFGFSDYNEYPSLCKLITSNDKLSIQVHPNDDYAIKNFNMTGKDECWYILNSNKDSDIICGLNEKLSKEDVKNFNFGEIKKLNCFNIKKHDFIYVPAGVVHAIGKGINLLEFQEPSELTFRLFDYNRLENGIRRSLHPLQACDVINNITNYSPLKILPFKFKYFNIEFRKVTKTYKYYDNICLWTECIVISGNGRVDGHNIKSLDAFIIGNRKDVVFRGKLELIFVKIYPRNNN